MSGFDDGIIDCTFDGALARITINRPAARNALRFTDWDCLAAAVRQAEAEGARAILLTGAGGCFCAGADLTEFDRFQAVPEQRVKFRLAMRRGIDTFAATPLPVIALIEGACFGAGVALAMAADMRITGDAARLAVTPAKIGIGYPQEDVFRLVTLAGQGAAARMLFTGAAIDGVEALRIGLVDGVGGAEEADRLTADILACESLSHFMLKRGIALAAGGASRDDEQDRRFDDLLGGEALAEALSRRRTKAPLPAAGS